MASATLPPPSACLSRVSTQASPACMRLGKPQAATRRACSTRGSLFDQAGTLDASGVAEPANPGMACFRQADGSLVCEAIATGVYEVKSAPPTWDGRAFCNTVNGCVECVTYCHQTPEGHLVCTGLEQGRYRVVAAQEADVEHLVHHIWASTYSEDDDEQLASNTVTCPHSQ